MEFFVRSFKILIPISVVVDFLFFLKILLYLIFQKIDSNILAPKGALLAFFVFASVCAVVMREYITTGEYKNSIQAKVWGNDIPLFTYPFSYAGIILFKMSELFWGWSS